MVYKSHKAAKTLAFLLALSAAAPTSVSFILRPAFAQEESAPFPVPTDVASDTVVRIDGSSSMAGINEALADRFREKFAGTKVELAYDGSSQALQSLINGDIDLASIGRSLTEQEKAQGLVEIPVARNKIAIIVGEDNPFDGSITTEQFAQLFRGEITDWSELGGEPGPIRFVDRPENSDTRQAFQNYPVFQSAPFATGENAETVSDDSTDAVVRELGSNGIGYAVFDQVQNQSGIKIISMHDVMPSDPRYPFSQPLSYVYKGPEGNASVRSFLGFAIAPENQQVIEEARTVTAAPATTAATASPEATATATPAATATASPEVVTTASPETVTSPDAAASAETETERVGGFPWWLLLIPLLGGLLWWLLKDRGGAAPAAAPVAAPVDSEYSRLILTPRNCRDAYAYWEVSDSVLDRLRQEGGRDLKLRLYDVTDIDMRNQAPHSTAEFDCTVHDQDLHVPIRVDNRDYIAELGYVTADNRWLSIAQSEPVRVPACEPVRGNGALSTAAAAAAGAVATGLAAKSLSTTAPSIAAPEPSLVVDDSRFILVPRSSDDVYAYWELSDAQKTTIREQGGYPLKLRLYDATDVNMDRQSIPVLKEYDCPEGDMDLHIPIDHSDRDYVADLGYTARDGQWVSVARSGVVHVPAATATHASTVGLMGGVTGVAAAGAAAVALGDRSRSVTSTSTKDEGVCQIILVPRNSQDAYVYWEVTDNYKLPLRQQGGQRLMLRVHDATNLDIDVEAPHSTQEYAIAETDQDKHVQVPTSDRDYIAEVGYYTADHRWLRIIRSFHTHVPADVAVL